MTERLFWAVRILDIACNGNAIALQNGKPVPCSEDIACSECGFFPKDCGHSCDYETRKWSESEHREEKSNEGED